jgi:hypothetical protein
LATNCLKPKKRKRRLDVRVSKFCPFNKPASGYVMVEELIQEIVLGVAE